MHYNGAYFEMVYLGYGWRIGAYTYYGRLLIFYNHNELFILGDVVVMPSIMGKRCIGVAYCGQTRTIAIYTRNKGQEVIYATSGGYQQV